MIIVMLPNAPQQSIDRVVAEIERALNAHELIKVRAAGLERDAREEAFNVICNKTGAAAVQQIGKIFVLFRKKDDQG